MVTFAEFVQTQVLKDKLPFDINFQIEAKLDGDVGKSIAGFDVPVYNELLAQEAWFFETLESMNDSKTSELQLMLRSLAKKLKTACELETISDRL